MKIVLTGSVGNISQPLANSLVHDGHDVTIISTNPAKTAIINELGGTAAIGSIDDVDFLCKAFAGADAVYCMVPPNFREPDPVAYYIRITNNYAKAIQAAQVKRAVYLSSYGAEHEQGTGVITGSHKGEELLKAVPGLSLTFVRPGYFFYNLLNFVKMIKVAGMIAANYGGNDKLLMVAPSDIAAAVAEELVNPKPDAVRYVGSDDRTCNEIAEVLGKAIGIPALQWQVISDEDNKAGLIAAGVPPAMAASLTELGHATHTGLLRGDVDQHPIPLGKVKLEDYAPTFAAVYHATSVDAPVGH
ncbi:NAD(P)H-binding protein [Chitinophaga sp. Cy-1792]|uniref:NmrA family NAD(P)-binding protein n=1 Tax=Chitinophaga sp. Cy-1792 TaxID=2608339 RepID=UPI001421F4C6|nr:NAD(P)H-binding protein [Chitinophaga sp. Cy-1792]NIG54820.1 NAD(P)H-binding protein [Chitinophaga sp. Cy-1792]